ncbi:MULTISPECIES: hypothetical protein [unclassified Bradyrhizobium]|uniref:hypothetical protein n=1 Tax=unclassified Bradyrhizobium TaxID=2631580 RepID=UPI001FFF6A8B|nr:MULTISPECIES: hypothetical protein [unclassified Bradyrhizobium]
MAAFAYKTPEHFVLAGRQRPWPGDLGFDDAWIAKCLDHVASKKSEQIVPTVTGKVYNHFKRMKEKRAVLNGIAAELRRIIAEPGLRISTRIKLATSV